MMGRSKPSRREIPRRTGARSALLKRATTGISGNGTASGLKTCMFGATGTHPAKPRRSLWNRRPRSLRLTPGRRVPIEFTQSTRFVRARIRMTCMLLVGSVPQSLPKQMIGVFPSKGTSSIGEGYGWDAGRGGMSSIARGMRNLSDLQRPNVHDQRSLRPVKEGVPAAGELFLDQPDRQAALLMVQGLRSHDWLEMLPGLLAQSRDATGGGGSRGGGTLPLPSCRSVAASSPSIKIRSHISRLTRSQRRLPC